MKFGKNAFRFDSRTLRMTDYVSTTYTPPPFASFTCGLTVWGMMLNDTLGDCTIAGLGHAEQVWTKGKTTVSDSVILAAYEQWCGYNPAIPSTDQGGIELDVLNSMKAHTLGGHVLEGYCDPQPQNLAHVMHAIAEFGGVYIGLQVPNSAITQNQKNQV